MAKNRYINTHFWEDSYVMELDPIEKLLFMYFLTNPLNNICGVYEIPVRRMAFDTGIDKEMILKILDRFKKAEKIYYEAGYIVIINFIKHQATNDNILKGIVDNLAKIPQIVKASEGFQRLSKALDYLNLNLNLNSNSNAPQETLPLISKTKIQKPEKQSCDMDSDLDFKMFWSMYGKKVGKEKTFKKWITLKKEEKQAIFKHLPEYTRNREPTYRKDPYSYLFNKCWNDEIVKPKDDKPPIPTLRKA